MCSAVEQFPYFINSERIGPRLVVQEDHVSVPNLKRSTETPYNNLDDSATAGLGLAGKSFTQEVDGLSNWNPLRILKSALQNLR